MRLSLLTGLIHFAGDLYPGMISPLLPFIRSALDLSRFQISLIPSIASFCMSCQPLFGMVADRAGWRWLLVFGLAAAAACHSALLLAGSFPVLCVLVAIGGLGVAAFHPPAAALAGNAGPNDRNRVMATFVSGGTVGFGLGTVIGPLLAESCGPPGPLLTVPVGLFVVALVLRSPGVAARRPSPEDPGPARDAYREVYFPVAVLLAVVVLRALAITGFVNLLPLHYAERGRSLVGGAWPLFVFIMVGALGNAVGGRLAERIGTRATLVGSGLAGAALMFASTRTDGALAYAAMWAASLTLNASVPVNILAAQDVALRRAGLISSLMMGFGWGMGGLLVPAFGYVAELFQSWQVALTALSAVPVAAAGVSLLVPGGAGVRRTAPDHQA